RIDPCDVGDRGAAERIGKPLRPNRIAVIARTVLRDDGAGDQLRARRKTWRQPASDAKTEDGCWLSRDNRFQGSRKTRGVTAARDREDAGPSDNPRFRPKAGDGNDPQAGHIPTRTGCRLPLLRLR